MTASDGASLAASDRHDQWFDEARVVDLNWVELSLTTPVGDSVSYRIPRWTFFKEIDQEAQPLE
ncbi:hypothetical protein ACFWN2_06470 [Lentzea sp. NPDC058436]|uniref:hypothetical protein n=1 Tax=Lentzea sp. NPDC058436 TaxID=3346499 RepID=UPI003669B3C0